MIVNFRAVKFHLATLTFSLVCGFFAWGGQNDARFTPSSAAALPAPFGTSFTFAQIEQEKFNLKDRVVRVEIEKVLGEGQDIGHDLRRYIVKDTSKSATPYGQIEFSREGLEKTGLQKEAGKPVTLFVQVQVISAKAAAICRALGIKSSPVGEKQADYEW